MSADLEGKAELESWAFDGGRIRLSSAKLSASHLTVLARDAGAVRAPVIAAIASNLTFDSRRGLGGQVVFDAPDLVVTDARVANGVLGEDTPLRVVSGTGHASAHLDIDLDSRTPRGSVKLRLDRLVTRYHGMRLSGDLRAYLSLRRAQAGRVDLSESSVVVDFGAVADAPTSTDTWWGGVELERGSFALGSGGPTFEGHVVAHCRDARPISAIFVHEAKLPDFIADMLSMEGLTAEATVALGPGDIDVRDFSARGGAFKLQGFFREIGEREMGAVLFEMGPFAAAVGVSNGKTETEFAGPTDWYRARKTLAAALPSAKGAAPR